MPRTASQWTAGALAIVSLVACPLIAVLGTTSAWARLGLIVAAVAIISLLATARRGADDQQSSLTAWLLTPPRNTWPSRPDHRQPATRLAAYGPVLVGSTIVTAAVVAGAAALLSTSTVSFDDVTPWIWLTVAGALALIALIIFSHAPQGPNWVERLAGVVGDEGLMLFGLSITALGTLGLFNFGMDGGDPSLLWTLIVAGGFITFLLGVGGPRPFVRGAARDHETAMADDARTAATRAADTVRAAERAVELAKASGTIDRAVLEKAREATKRATTASETAARASKRVGNAVDQIGRKREQARDAVLEAETEAANAARHAGEAQATIESTTGAA